MQKKEDLRWLIVLQNLEKEIYWVSVASAGNILAGSTILQRKYRLGDHLTSVLKKRVG